LLLADAQEQVGAALEDDLEELRELLGIPADPSWDTHHHDEDDAPDPESRHELQRLLAHLDSPVSAGSDYTVLQVYTKACFFCIVQESMFSFVQPRIRGFRTLHLMWQSAVYVPLPRTYVS
jgi:hypothetical protein